MNKYYDQGWNDYNNNRPYKKGASKDYEDGWLDCREATLKSGPQKDI